MDSKKLKELVNLTWAVILQFCLSIKKKKNLTPITVRLFFQKWFFSKFFCVYLLLEKLINKKYFQVNGKYFRVKEKIGFIFKKVFSFYFGRKIFSRSCKRFKNIILFADYVKFGPQTFDCYIFCLNLFFNFIP